MRNLRSRSSSTTWRRSRKKRRVMSPARRTSKSSTIGSKRRASELLFLKWLSYCFAQRVCCSLFGQPGSQYDFSKIDIAQLKDRTRDLEEQQRGMKKKVNPKAMNMIDT